MHEVYIIILSMCILHAAYSYVVTKDQPTNILSSDDSS